jgi:ketosteroid isomerase-like protein
MPEESTAPNLEELTRRSFDAYNRGDLDGTVAMYRDDAVWDTSALGLGVYEGRKAVRTVLGEWLGTYDEFEQVMVEYRDFGRGITFAVYAQRGRPTGSSEFVEVRAAVVTTWRDALIERAAPYTDIDQARAAAERLAEERA